MGSPLKSRMDPKEHLLDTRRNFGEYILQHMRRHAKSKWINGTSHESQTFGEVSEHVEAVRAALYRLGIRPGDKLLLFSANRLQLLPLFIGAVCANVACVFESPGFGVDVLAGRMESLGLVAICCGPNQVHEALELQRKLVSVKHVIAFDEPAHKADSAASRVTTWSELLENGRASNGLLLPPIEYRENQICYLTPTSGTTGKPKLVVHTHESLLGNVQANSHPRHMPLGAEDVQLSTSCLGHTYALFDCVSKAIVQGASVVFLEVANDDTAVLGAIQRHRVTAISTTPYMARCLLENKMRKNYDISCLRYLTTATTYMAKDVADALMREFKPKTFTQLYGQSEIPFIAAGLYEAPSKYMSVGPLAMGVEAMVRDVETKKPLGPWERGELVVRGPGLMRGYWGKLHESVTDDQGWYSTGDQSYYDDEGWLYLVQRLNDFYICRGRRFWPVEVEEVLLKCPEVHDCAVVGLPHPEAGEVAHAVIVPEHGAETAVRERIQRFVEDNAPTGGHLEGGVTFVDKIPRNELGKFSRPHLVQWVLEKQKGLN